MITFQNKNFKIREVSLPKFGEVLISVNSLNNLLLNEYGAYISEEAMFVDEKIFFFVEDNQIELPENELKTLLLSEVL